MTVHEESLDVGYLLGKPENSKLSIVLSRKDTVVGSEAFRQYWLRNSSVYGLRRRTPQNLQAILEFFRVEVNRTTDGDGQRNAAETYLLASLVPKIRSNGAQRVFPDASLSNLGRLKSQELVADLEQQLLKGSHCEIDAYEFYEQSRIVCDLADMPNEVVDEYQSFESRLLDGVVDDWSHVPEECSRIVEQRWSRWMKGVGRRAANEVAKQVLDILSYECKTALHQCYSLFWLYLADALAEKEQSRFVGQFHRFWHCDHRLPTGGVQDMHLLHGHVFALHPAFALMIQTATGGEIIADAAGAGYESSEMLRFFAAGILALNCYMSDRIESRRRL